MTKVKVTIKVEIPQYSEKHCDSSNGEMCPYLQYYHYGLKCYCLLSGKQIQFKPEIFDSNIKRPYGCRCLAKKFEKST